MEAERQPLTAEQLEMANAVCEACRQGSRSYVTPGGLKYWPAQDKFNALIAALLARAEAAETALAAEENLAAKWRNEALALEREHDKEHDRLQLENMHSWGEGWKERAYKAEAALADRVDALRMLRDAWNAHMETCPQHAELAGKIPTFEEIQGWMSAPSNTASAALAGSSPACDHEWVGGDTIGNSCPSCKRCGAIRVAGSERSAEHVFHAQARDGIDGGGRFVATCSCGWQSNVHVVNGDEARQWWSEHASRSIVFHAPGTGPNDSGSSPAAEAETCACPGTPEIHKYRCPASPVKEQT